MRSRCNSVVTSILLDADARLPAQWARRPAGGCWMKTRVLVVAGESTLRAAVARDLQSAGCSVELAANEKRAQELVARGAVDAAIVAPAALGARGIPLA